MAEGLRSIRWPRSACTASRVEPSARFPEVVSMEAGAPGRFASLRVVIVGAGSVGREVAVNLARHRVAELTIVDPGRYKAESLLTHSIGPRDVGQAKAVNTGRLCKRLSPRTDVSVFEGPIERLAEADVAFAHVAVMAVDNLPAEAAAGRLFGRMGVPLVHAAVHGGFLVAQVRVFGHGAGGEGPCVQCGYTAQEEALLEGQTRFSCEVGGSDRGEQGGIAAVRAEPTRSTASLCHLAANLACVQLERHVLGVGAAVTDRMIEYCGLNDRATVSPLCRRPDCAGEHERWRVVVMRRLAGRRLGEIVATGVADDRSKRSATIRVDRHRYAERIACGCGNGGAGFVPEAELGRCGRCGRRRGVDPLRVLTEAPVAGLSLGRTLAAQGAGWARWAVVRSGGATTLVCEPDGKGDKEID